MTPTRRPAAFAFGQPWAVAPAQLESILAVIQRHSDQSEAVAAKLGSALPTTRTASVREDVAIIDVSGPIFRRANFWTDLGGASAVETLALDLQAAIEDASVQHIVLQVDSPGGQAAGIAELANMIRASRKPVTAYVDGMAASAAYWLTAAAHQVVLSRTALVGSIGIVSSYRPEQDGPIKVISSQSPLKQVTPDTTSGRAEVQRVVDQLAAVFVADLAGYRRKPEAYVLSAFGKGGLLVGQSAVVAGMADALGSLEGVIQGPRPAIKPTVLKNPARQASPSSMHAPRAIAPRQAQPIRPPEKPMVNTPPKVAAPQDVTAARRKTWEADAALRQEFRSFERYDSYLSAQAAGRARIIGGTAVLAGRP